MSLPLANGVDEENMHFALDLTSNAATATSTANGTVTSLSAAGIASEPSRKSPGRRACKFKQVQDALVDLERKARDLRSQLNSLTPVGMLPPEILAKIFIHSVVHISDQHGYVHWQWRLAHVCRQWRGVSLGHAKLWSFLTPMPDAMSVAWLGRSKNIPLSIDFDCSFYPNAAMHLSSLRLITNEICRARLLQLIIPPEEMDQIENLLCWREPAPLLEILVIAPANATSLPSENAITPTSELAADVFSGIAPRLQVVQLVACSVDWKAQIMSGLTSLSLCVIPATSRVEMTDMIHILDRCPGLTTVQLIQALKPDSSEDAIRSNCTITLSSLHTIVLASEGTESFHLLRQVLLPPTVNLTLDCRQILVAPAALFLASLQFSTIASSNHSPFVALYMEVLPRSLRFKATTGCAKKADPSSAGESRSDDQNIVLNSRFDGRCAGVLLSIGEALELSRVTAVTFAFTLTALGCSLWEEWEEVNHVCPRVRSLAIQGCANHRLASLISAITPAQDGSALLFPEVTHLRISKMHWENVEDMLHCLSRRRGSGTILAVLEISQCTGFTGEYAEALRVVVDVVWDGKEEVETG